MIFLSECSLVLVVILGVCFAIIIACANFFFEMFFCGLPQNPNIVISTTNFTVGSSRTCNLPLKEQCTSGVLCKIKRTQVLDQSVISHSIEIHVQELRC